MALSLLLFQCFLCARLREHTICDKDRAIYQNLNVCCNYKDSIGFFLSNNLLEQSMILL